jgi:hypothetical protein
MSSNTIANAHKIRPRRTNRKLQLWTDVSKINSSLSLSEPFLSFEYRADPVGLSTSLTSHPWMTGHVKVK